MPKLAQETYTERAVHGLETAKRFKQFRMEVIDKNQIRAAEKLGVSQGYLSNVESGKRPINWELRDKLVLDFGMNPNFISTGATPMLAKSKPSKQPSDAQQILDRLTILTDYIKTLERTINTLINEAERQSKRIEVLEEKLNELS